MSREKAEALIAALRAKAAKLGEAARATAYAGTRERLLGERDATNEAADMLAAAVAS